MLRWAQSIFKSLYAGIALAEGQQQDSNGIYNTFAVDNGNGIMFRIGATGSGLPNKWDGVTAIVTLNYQLGRSPIGFIVCDLDANAVIWRMAPGTATSMTLKTSNTAVNATVYIF